MSNEDTIGGMHGVTIAREYGGGGGEIARRLATRLGWQLLDHQIVAEVAHRIGFLEADANRLDEHRASFLTQLLSALAYAVPPSPLVPSDPPPNYQSAVRQLLQHAPTAGQVVIVGRGGQLALAERRDVLHVGVIAPLPGRLAYVMRREGLTEAQARARIQHEDQERQGVLQEEYGQNGLDNHLYDLVINTAVLDLDSAVDLIVLALKCKGRRLHVPAEELGPGAGLALYPTSPAATV